MKTSMRIEGMAETSSALAELTKATQRNVMRRVLQRAGEPIAEEARRLVPVASGDLRDSISVLPRVRNTVGDAAYASALEGGATRAGAVTAKRDALRTSNGGSSFAEMFVGPISLPYAHMIEFGTVNMEPRPYMRPAFDAKSGEAVAIIARDMGKEIDRAAQRTARKAARIAAKAKG